jgi:hypothetical protein
MKWAEDAALAAGVNVEIKNGYTGPWQIPSTTD